jgi:thiamine monophosphate synthase
METQATKQNTMTLAITDELKAALDAEANRVHVSPSDLVLEAVRQRLNITAGQAGGSSTDYSDLLSFAGVGVQHVGYQKLEDVEARMRDFRED